MHWSSTSSEFQQWLEPASSMPQSTVFMLSSIYVNSIYVHTINMRKLNNYLPAHKSQWRQQIQISNRPSLFHRLFSSQGKKQRWTATFELSHECPTVNYPRSWQHTKNVADPSAVNENNNQCNLHLLQWIIKFRKNDLSYTIYISCTMVQNDSTLACTI